MAVQKSGDVDWSSNVLPTFLQDLILVCHVHRPTATRPRRRVTRDNSRSASACHRGRRTGEGGPATPSFNFLTNAVHRLFHRVATWFVCSDPPGPLPSNDDNKLPSPVAPPCKCTIALGHRAGHGDHTSGTDLGEDRWSGNRHFRSRLECSCNGVEDYSRVRP